MLGYSTGGRHRVSEIKRFESLREVEYKFAGNRWVESERFVIAETLARAFDLKFRIAGVSKGILSSRLKRRHKIHFTVIGCYPVVDL